MVSGSSAPDYLIPNHSSQVLHHLGIHECAAVSLVGGCSNFVDSLAVARSFLVSGMARVAVVTGAESISTYLPSMRTPFDAMLFGDAAGAVVLSVVPGSGEHPVFEVDELFIATRTRIDDCPADVARITLGADRVGPKPVGLSAKPREVDPRMTAWWPALPERYRPVHDGRLALAGAVPAMLEAVQRVTKEVVGPGLVVSHQGSRAVLDGLARELPHGWDRIDNLAHRGNMCSASIPVAFHEHLPQVCAATNVVLATVGAGLSFGAVRLRRLDRVVATC